MSQIDNLNDARAEIRDLMRRVSQLERQSPIGFSSVTRGSLRIASAEGLIVEGSARITGTLNGDGTMSWTGPVEFVGPVSITGNVTRSGTETATGTTTLNGTTNLNGPTNITGATDITGTLDVSGVTTVTNDLNVTGGGEITAGAVTISPASGGRVSIGSFTLASDGSLTDDDPLGVRVNGTLTAQDITSSTTVRVGTMSPDPGGTRAVVWHPTTKMLHYI